MTALDSIWLARPETPPSGPRAVAVKDLLDTAGLDHDVRLDHLRRARAGDRTRRRSTGSKRPATSSPARRTCTSSPTASARRTRTSAPCRTRGSPAGSPAARAAAPRRRSQQATSTLALGTDSGGSIRIPAAWCGIVGFKPTFDLVDATGCFPLAPSYDHVGPMASTRRRLHRADARARAGLRAGGARRRSATCGRHRLARRGRPAVARPRRRGARRASRAAAPSSSRCPDPAENALFMREVADVHRGALPRARGRVRRERPLEDRALPRGDRRRGRRRRERLASRVPRALRRALRRPRPARDARRSRSSRRPRTSTSSSSAGARSASRTRSTRSAGPHSRSPCGPDGERVAGVGSADRAPRRRCARFRAGCAARIPRLRDGCGPAVCRKRGMTMRVLRLAPFSLPRSSWRTAHAATGAPARSDRAARLPAARGRAGSDAATPSRARRRSPGTPCRARSATSSSSRRAARSATTAWSTTRTR